MSRFSVAVAVLLACANMLAAGAASAQVRGPSVKEIQERTAVDADIARAAELAALNAWLKRLVGRFRIPDMKAIEPFTGALWDKGEGNSVCVSIGPGPGVQCMFSVRWSKHDDPGVDRGISDLYVIGVDPDELGIRYMVVNGRSIAESELGKREGDTVAFSKLKCFFPRIPEDISLEHIDCYKKIRIYAPPDGGHVRIDTTMVHRLLAAPNPSHPVPHIQVLSSTESMDMERVPEDQSAKTPQAKSAH